MLLMPWPGSPHWWDLGWCEYSLLEGSCLAWEVTPGQRSVSGQWLARVQKAGCLASRWTKDFQSIELKLVSSWDPSFAQFSSAVLSCFLHTPSTESAPLIIHFHQDHHLRPCFSESWLQPLRMLYLRGLSIYITENNFPLWSLHP